ncbi:MAG: phosphoglycerate kinase [Lachnospiraceae bacterium]|nr:phosphoglycerate kinase [Candidatus Equihabitans merdae]
MEFGIKTLDEYELQGKTVLCRVDMNQPVDKATDTLKSINRIRACAPTIKEMSDKGAKVVLMAHQGSDIEYKNFYTTRPHGKVLSELIGKEVKFIDDVCGPAAREAIKALKDGEILLLDNVRFVSEEQTLFEMKLQLTHEQQADTLMVRTLAPLADLYVCDAFAAAHRDQPSLCGFEQVLPSAMGRLFQAEYVAVAKVMEAPEHPCTFILGGSKISDAFMMMETVLSRGIADKVLTGGLVSNILLAAKGEDIGEGSLNFIRKSNYEDWIEKAKPLYEKYKDQIVLPKDLAYVEDGVRKEAKVGEIPASAGLVDIGHEAVAEYRDIILNSKTVCVNGPMGIFEEEITEYGTKSVWEAMADSEGYTLIGGGDSVTATEKYNLKDRMSYICTAGGALIRFLSGEELPVVKALRHAAKTFD